MPYFRVDDDMEQAYKQAPEKPDVYEPLPDGAYTVRVEHIMPKTIKDDSVVEWQFAIVEGEFKNRKIWLTRWLKPEQAEHIRRDFNIVGLTGASLKAILNNEEKLRSVAGTILEVKVVSDKNGKTDRAGNIRKYTNISKFISFSIGGTSTSTTPPPAKKHDDDEVPF